MTFIVLGAMNGWSTDVFGQSMFRQGKKKKFECFEMGQMLSSLPDPCTLDFLTPSFLGAYKLRLYS